MFGYMVFIITFDVMKETVSFTIILDKSDVEILDRIKKEQSRSRKAQAEFIIKEYLKTKKNGK